MSNHGWISLHRKIQDTPIYSDSHAVHLWVHLLLKANHQDKEFLFNGSMQTVKRGQLLTGRKVLSSETGINESKIQRLLKTFEKCQMIEQQANNKSRLISITNYDSHQASEQQVNSKRTTDEQQVNTNNNVNKDNKVNKFSFKNELIGLGVDESIADDWLTVRKKKRASNTQTALNGLINQIEKTSLSTNEVIKLCVENSWSGFKADYIKDDANNIPYEKIMELFNKHCSSLNTCFDLTANRKRGIAEIWNADTRHQEGKFWVKYLSTINSSADITNQWENSADYAFNYKTFVKLMEATC